MTLPVFQEWEAYFDQEAVTLSRSLDPAKCDDSAQLWGPHTWYQDQAMLERLLLSFP